MMSQLLQIPQVVGVNARMTITALRVYCTIANLTKNRTTARIVIADLAHQLETSGRSVFRALAFLKEESLILAKGDQDGIIVSPVNIKDRHHLPICTDLLFTEGARLSDILVDALERALTKNGKCYARRKYLAETLGIAEDEVSKARGRIRSLPLTSRAGTPDKKSRLRVTSRAELCVPPSHSPYKVDTSIRTDNPASALYALAYQAMQNKDSDSPDNILDLFKSPEVQKKLDRVDARQGTKPVSRRVRGVRLNKLDIENADSWSDTDFFEYVLLLGTRCGVPMWYPGSEGLTTRSAALANMKVFCRMAAADLSSRAKLAAFLKVWFENWESFCRSNPRAEKIGFNPNYWRTGVWKDVKAFMAVKMKPKSSDSSSSLSIDSLGF